ncbi:hypothetical protein ACOJUR_08190 [Alicyclobacillus tolerans]|uniref:hypothetical protein n=1 Tax=Alicyclobacillus tolerans TaxID=90970 RepID=UPI003B82BB2E
MAKLSRTGVETMWASIFLNSLGLFTCIPSWAEFFKEKGKNAGPWFMITLVFTATYAMGILYSVGSPPSFHPPVIHVTATYVLGYIILISVGFGVQFAVLSERQKKLLPDPSDQSHDSHRNQSIQNHSDRAQSKKDKKLGQKSNERKDGKNG